MALARFPFAPGVLRLRRRRLSLFGRSRCRAGAQAVRVRFDAVVPLTAGFACIADYLQAHSRPLPAWAAVELRCAVHARRIPDFNRGYVDVLDGSGPGPDGLNSVARSNVCPVHDAPAEPGFLAFYYTSPNRCCTRGAPAIPFVIAGSGEWPEDQPFPASIVAQGDLSARGLEAKAEYVLQTMQARCEALGCAWSSVAAAQIYCVHDIHPLVEARLATTGLLRHGLTWQICAPPVCELEFEMDVRRVTEERLLAADPTAATGPAGG